jgi:hypothetical protein
MKLLFNKNLALLLTGIFIVTFILWNRIIRVHLPRDIPYTLTDLSFILLLALCITFLILLILLIKIYLLHKAQTAMIGAQLHVFLAESLQELDYRIRSNPNIFSIINRLSNMLFIYSKKYISYSKHIFLLFHFVKILVPIMLLLDIIYFCKIALFYNMLILLLIPLAYRYLYHMLNQIYTLETYVSDQRLTIRLQTLCENELIFMHISKATHYYIQETTLERLKIRDNNHVFHFTLSTKYMQENPDADWEAAFNSFESNLDYFSTMFEVLSTYYQLKKNYDPWINAIMISIYLICWSYVLYTSTYMLSSEFINLIKQLQDTYEPFSGLDLPRDGKDFYKISETDFDGENKEQYARLYSNPHDVDPTDIDTTRSNALNKNHEALETILKNAK